MRDTVDRSKEIFPFFLHFIEREPVSFLHLFLQKYLQYYLRVLQIYFVIFLSILNQFQFPLCKNQTSKLVCHLIQSIRVFTQSHLIFFSVTKFLTPCILLMYNIVTTWTYFLLKWMQLTTQADVTPWTLVTFMVRNVRLEMSAPQYRTLIQKSTSLDLSDILSQRPFSYSALNPKVPSGHYKRRVPKLADDDMMKYSKFCSQMWQSGYQWWSH